jgi:uncharacterized membrane protein YphA (DoxX/SURF4 family)
MPLSSRKSMAWKVTSISLFCLLLYLFSWFLAYVLVFLMRRDNLDVSYVIQYFFLAWSFRGLEIPASIQIVSVIIFLLAGSLILWGRKE